MSLGPGFRSILVTSFLVFHTKVTVNIGLKAAVRMVTSIPLIRCLCYKPERIRPFSFSSPNASQLFNSRESLLLETFKKEDIGVVNLRFGHLSDLIQHKTGNGLRHASSPAWSNLPPVTYLHQQDQMFLFSYYPIFPNVLFAFFHVFLSFYFPIFYKDLSHVFLQQFGKEEMFVNMILWLIRPFWCTKIMSVNISTL